MLRPAEAPLIEGLAEERGEAFAARKAQPPHPPCEAAMGRILLY